MRVRGSIERVRELGLCLRCCLPGGGDSFVVVAAAVVVADVVVVVVVAAAAVVVCVFVVSVMARCWCRRFVRSGPDMTQVRFTINNRIAVGGWLVCSNCLLY